VKNKGCFLLTAVLNSSNNWPIENGVLGGRGGLTAGAKWPSGKIYHQNTFWVDFASNHASHGEL